MRIQTLCQSAALRLRSINTSGCILDTKGNEAGIDFTSPPSPKRGAGAVYLRQSSLVDSGLRIGPCSLPRDANATFAKGGF